MYVLARLDESEHLRRVRDLEQSWYFVALVRTDARVVVAGAPQVSVPSIWCEAARRDVDFARSRERRKRKHSRDRRKREHSRDNANG